MNDMCGEMRRRTDNAGREIARAYETERLILKVLEPSAAEMVLDYYVRNSAFLEEWEPARGEAFYTRAHHEALLEADWRQIAERSALRLWIFQKDDKNRVIGTIGFGNIVWGAFLSCFLGYKLDEGEINRGYMTEAIRRGIEIIFEEYGLHRIEANILPRNSRSLRVAEKLGFIREGLARKYLRINGVWEDHIHMVLLNERM
jgi:ribosomal-protein-alanine N-acetyltransferase